MSAKAMKQNLCIVNVIAQYSYSDDKVIKYENKLQI